MRLIKPSISLVTIIFGVNIFLGIATFTLITSQYDPMEQPLSQEYDGLKLLYYIAFGLIIFNFIIVLIFFSDNCIHYSSEEFEEEYDTMHKTNNSIMFREETSEMKRVRIKLIHEGYNSLQINDFFNGLDVLEKHDFILLNIKDINEVVDTKKGTLPHVQQ